MDIKEKTVYLKAERHSTVKDTHVFMRDVCKIWVDDKELMKKINQIKIHDFSGKDLDNKENRAQGFSVLYLVSIIEKNCPDVSVEVIGDVDFVVEMIEAKELFLGLSGKFWEAVKITLLCIVIFLGAAFTIMAFNNDISITGVFERLYTQVKGGQKPEISELEIGYCIGLFVGIMVFFNHVGKKKLTTDETPIQVEVKKHEQDIDKAFIETANRRGELKDVE